MISSFEFIEIYQTTPPGDRSPNRVARLIAAGAIMLRSSAKKPIESESKTSASAPIRSALSPIWFARRRRHWLNLSVRGSSASAIGQCLGNRFRIVLAFIFFVAERILFFSLAHALRLQQMQGQGDSHMEALSAQTAANWKLQQSETRKIGDTHPRCPKFWSTAIGAIHRETCSLS